MTFESFVQPIYFVFVLILVPIETCLLIDHILISEALTIKGFYNSLSMRYYI